MVFRVGQKVVCVDAKFPGFVVRGPDLLLHEGAIFTVAAIENGDLHLVEIKRARNSNGMVLPYRASRFRPIVERKTDISIFEAMLTDTRQPVSLGE